MSDIAAKISLDVDSEIILRWQMLRNLVAASALCLICCFIYIVFPVVTAGGYTNFWLFYVAKETFWTAFGLSAMIEVFEACLPGFPRNAYVYLYPIALSLRALIHIVARVIWHDANSLSLIYGAASVPRLLIILVYGLWVYLYAPSALACQPESVAAEASTRTTFNIIIANRPSTVISAGGTLKDASVASVSRPGGQDQDEVLNPVQVQRHSEIQLSQTVNVEEGTLHSNRLASLEVAMESIPESSPSPSLVDSFPIFVERHRLLPRFMCQGQDGASPCRLVVATAYTHFWLAVVYVMVLVVAGSTLFVSALLLCSLLEGLNKHCFCSLLCCWCCSHRLWK